ncbi:hypothetical protein K503DRAFT_778636 [Rhizopogon vinicolor AM-OR11-026]|uniref:Uncharacterized protein n=1 Tax=Rhizopogon vinicolor AM-OR11-026 TaxID=1314800 RepID=A0A1B7NHR8_9AGAM|nr:hypothetical protein K503DRAFT_778636 [Rhizopogon vinicolor AM-OR11-026]
MPVRMINDAPFPSFSLVMSQYSTGDLRLPSYRMAYLLRFHPYPRVKLSNREIMQTIDDRLSSVTQYGVIKGDGTTEPHPLIFSDIRPEEEQHHNAVNLQEAIEVAEVGAQPRVRRLSLTILIIRVASAGPRGAGYKEAVFEN